MKQLEDRTLACTHALTVELDPRSLKLNARKGETLLSCKGKGAYNAAKRAVSGEWKGYPVKLCVKYLGAQLQANGSLRAELQKRIGAARSGFARFSKLFKSRTVPVARKVLIFKAVVNEALLAALEVRPLGCSGCHTLERARGLLLRSLFGRQGFGAVAGDDRHESVTVESLRRRVQLSTVASELTVRRLMWLRASLLAEMRGQTRLELAALFGACDKLADAVDLRSGFRRKRPHVSCILSSRTCLAFCLRLLASKHTGSRISYVYQWTESSNCALALLRNPILHQLWLLMLLLNKSLKM